MVSGVNMASISHLS